MSLIDITLPLSPETPTYKGKKRRVELVPSRKIEQGANETLLTFESHTGTHVDAPLHMIAGGRAIDRYPLNWFEGKALVVEIRGTDRITDEHLMPFIEEPFPGDFLLLKTDNSFTDLNRENFTYLAESGAHLLAELSLKGVGIDSLGIERDQPGHPTHRLLLEKDILIFEGLALGKVPAGWYHFQAYPLLILDGDGAPARAALRSLKP